MFCEGNVRLAKSIFVQSHSYFDFCIAGRTRQDSLSELKKAEAGIKHGLGWEPIPANSTG